MGLNRSLERGGQYLSLTRFSSSENQYLRSYGPLKFTEKMKKNLKSSLDQILLRSFPNRNLRKNSWCLKKKIISNGILQVKIWTMRLSIMNEFDRNFWARRLPYALSKYEKRVSRQKIKENRSWNRFPTILPSYFRCLKVSLGTAPSNVVFNFVVYHPPLGPPGVGKRFFVKSHGLGRIYKWSPPP